MNILLVGCGSIGTVIAKAADNIASIEKILIYDVDNSKAEQLKSKISKSVLISDLNLRDVDASIVIEAASQEAAKHVIPAALESGMDAMIMSVGAFRDRAFQNRCFNAVSSGENCLLIPSGAVAGIDALKGAAKADIDEVKLTTTKPPKGLTGVRYLIDKGIIVEDIQERTILYSGPASQAIQYFPANVNVAATVSLASIGFERTEVEIICDPNQKVNSHRLFARGAFGELEAITRNLPSSDNPKTSYLASLSAVSALNSYINRIWIGF